MSASTSGLRCSRHFRKRSRAAGDVAVLLDRLERLVFEQDGGIRSQHRPPFRGFEPLHLRHRVQEGGIEGQVGDVGVVDVFGGRRPFARQQDAELALSDQAEQVDVDHPAREAVVLVIRPAQAGEVLADCLDRDLAVALAGLGLDPLFEVLDELVALGVELLGAVLLHDAQGIADSCRRRW